MGELGSIPEFGRSPGEENSYPLTFSCLKSSKDRGAWQATVHGIAKSQTVLNDFHFSYQFSVKQLIFQMSILRFPFLSFSVPSLHGCTGFLKLWQASTCYSLTAIYRLLIAEASHCSGFSFSGTQTPEDSSLQASVVVARGLNSCGSQTLEHRLSSCGTGV